MPAIRIQACFAALSLSAAMVAQAADAPAAAGVPQRIDCEALASGMNASAAVERCKADTAGMAELMQAMNQPGGERPGDDRMTCAQIMAELRVVSGPGVSAQNRAEAAAAGQQLRETSSAQIARSQAMAAAQTARTAAAAGIDVATGSNVAGGKAAAQNTAEQTALQADATAQVGAARARAAAAIANARGDLATSLRSNPRMGRLIQLAGAKNCQE